MADWRLDQRTEETPVESDITILSRGTSTFKTTFKKIKDFIIGTTTLTTTDTTVTGAIEEVKGIADNNTTQLNDLANPNILINGDFQVWQRGISFNGESYTADRWRVAQGNTTLSTLNNKNAIRITRTSSDTSETNLEYKMENLQTMKGKTYTLSWEGMANVNVTYSTLIFFSGDNGSKEFLNSEDKDYVSNVTTKHSITFTLPADIDSEYTILGIRILRRATVNEHTITVTNIKMEVGSLATPFIPRLYSEELALCQRYYREYDYGIDTGGKLAIQFSNELMRVHFDIDVNPAMRIVPTITAVKTYESGIRFLSSSGLITIPDVSIINATPKQRSNVDNLLLALNLSTQTSSASSGWIDGFKLFMDSEIY